MASLLLGPGLKLYTLHFTEAYGNGIVSTLCVSKPEYNLSCFLNLAKLIGWLLQDN